MTLGLFVWVLWLAEGRPWSAYGFRGAVPMRLALAMALALGATLVVSHRAWFAVASGQVTVTPDSLVFALLFGIVGSALPEEMLFRGFLQGSLGQRVGLWARLVFPALAFTAVRALRHLPGTEMELGHWLSYVLGVAFPLGLWWGLMRDLAGGSLWPSLVAHAVFECGRGLVSASPGTSPGAP